MRAAAIIGVGVFAILLPKPAAAQGDAVWLTSFGFPLGRAKHGKLERVPCSPRASFAGASKGDRWQAIDEIGRIVGEASVKDTSVYDLSGCIELSVEKTSGSEGAGLWVHGGNPARRSSFACDASARRPDIRRSFRVAARRWGLAAPKKIQFFCGPADKGAPSWIRAWADGKRFVVGRLGKGGHWRSELVLDRGTDFDGIAVVDLDENGTPELVVQRIQVDVFDFAAYILDGVRWRERLTTETTGFA